MGRNIMHIDINPCIFIKIKFNYIGRGERGEMGQKNLLACCALNFPQKLYKSV